MGCRVCYLSTEEHQSPQLGCGKRSYLHLLFEHFWGGGVGVSAVALCAGRASTSGVQATLAKLRDGSWDYKTQSLKADVCSLYK